MCFMHGISRDAEDKMMKCIECDAFSSLIYFASIIMLHLLAAQEIILAFFLIV